MTWTKERLNEIEDMCNNTAIDKSVLQAVLLSCVDELRRLYGYMPVAKNLGKKIRITGNTNEHEFEIGQTVVIVEFEDFDPADAEYGVEAAPLNGGEHWFVRHGDYEFVNE